VLASLKSQLRREYNFDADMKHLGIFGRCGDCR
jgi:hypothetical protein